MTDLSALTADQLAEKVRAFAEHPYAGKGRGMYLHREADDALSELVRRASERDPDVCRCDKCRDCLAADRLEAAEAERDQAVTLARATKRDFLDACRDRNAENARANLAEAERDQAVRERDDWKQTAGLAAAAELKHEQRADRLAAALGEHHAAIHRGLPYPDSDCSACRALAASKETPE